MAVPILSGDEVVAVLCVDSGRGRALDRQEVVTLETLADGIGILLRNAELYRALEETNERLVELDRMKSELVNIVAHDFRSPLTGILSYAELLEWKPEAPLRRSRGARPEHHPLRHPHVPPRGQDAEDHPARDRAARLRVRPRRRGRRS